MPLESATYISDLVASNPAASDPLSNADDHMRLIKGVLKAQFPNFTGTALTSSNSQIDTTVTTVSGGIAVLADAGVNFKTNSTDGFTNPAAGTVAINTGGTSTTTFTSGGISTSTVSASTALVGPGVVPIGGMIMWLSDTLPTVGTWCWANGGVLSRTGVGATLFSMWGTKYGAGDGSTTFNVINMQEVVPAGKATMGGAGNPNYLGYYTPNNGVLGAIFGAAYHTLSINELPAHTHPNTLTDPGHHHTVGASNSIGGGGGSGQFINTNYGVNPYSTDTVETGITLTNASIGGGASFGMAQPTIMVNFIIRIG